MPLVLGFPTPETVLAMTPSELDAVAGDVALATHPPGSTLTTVACLWALGRRGKEEVCQALAGARIHPIVFGVDSIDRNLDCGH